jgi:hypothetical protein
MNKLILTIAMLLTVASSAFAQIGSAASDLVFTPVAPCRILDTRQSQGGTGPIPSGGTKSFIVWGNSFGPQGGAVTNCGITASGNTTGIAVNLTVVTPATSGYITAFPYNTLKPMAATVNFNTGDVRGNLAIVQIPVGVNSFDMSIYSSSTTDIVGDIVGFYSKPVATALECIDTLPTTTFINQNLSQSYYTAVLTVPNCPAGLTSVSIRCGVDHQDATASRSSELTAGQTPICYGRSLFSTHILYASRTCCRIPGR